MEKSRSKLIVGISGATGAILGVRLLQTLQHSNVDTHLVFSNWGARTLIHETAYTVEQVQQMATCHYAAQDQGAVISSGSFDRWHGGVPLQREVARGHSPRPWGLADPSRRRCGAQRAP